jgi:polyvinyl alcohol dehydrogenase (cytochrome)
MFGTPRDLNALIGRTSRPGTALGAAVVMIISVAASLASGVQPARAAAVNDWPTYLSGLSRTGFAQAEKVITPSSARSLRLRWTASAAGAASAEPVVAGGVIYWGSWDGHERATTSSGGLLWTSRNLGSISNTHCKPPSVGLASTATVGMTLLGGKPVPAVFVGGGDGYFYALNAQNGFVIWRTRLWTDRGTFLWSSPAYYRGSIYQGVASVGDCPLVRGKMVRLNANTGAVQRIFYTAPAGCTGAGVWGSPAIDAPTGHVYFATGNGSSRCSQGNRLSTALVELTASGLRLVGHWQVPPSQHGPDSDFGSTPTLFTATSGGKTRAMVGLVNKNGVYYAFNRANISAGPVWRARIASPGPCPECGPAAISPSAWDGRLLYIAGGNVVINGTKCRGTLRAVSPATGRQIWRRCLPFGPVLGAVTAVPGVVVIGTGAHVLAVNARTGATLFQFKDATPGSTFWGAASFSNGTLYVANQDGRLFAFSPAASRTR